ncbi:MAG: Biotin synthase [Methanothrix sp.]|jgi:biotin synthase-related radical SAM superfamily protein|nr:MAG: Biotin synthase [Methanothrix sp.]
MDAETKALLVSIGSADIDGEVLKEGFRTTVPSAGPGAGKESFFFRSGGHRVRLSISRRSPLKVLGREGDVIILHKGAEIARGRLEPALCHCPQQAYLTVSPACIFDCKFCPVPKLSGEPKDLGRILELVEEADQTGEMRAISLTSGVARSPEEEVDKVASAVRALREVYDLPIGVSVYPTSSSSEILSAAGATEVKYNVETMDREIFERCCPGLSLPFVLESLEKAVEIFGENRVTTNFIIGLGEGDATVKAGARRLVEMGVIPILRPISPHPLRAGEVYVKRPSADRLLALARMLLDLLDEHGLRADVAETMCLPCTGCDMTPHRDVTRGGL